MADFSTETAEARKQWHTYKVLKEKDQSTKNPISGKTIFQKNQGKMKTFPD